MKESKEQVIKALHVWGKEIGLTTIIINAYIENLGILATIKEIAFIGFSNNYTDYFETEDRVYEAILILRRYSIEMKKHGEVVFNKK